MKLIVAITVAFAIINVITKLAINAVDPTINCYY